MKYPATRFLRRLALWALLLVLVGCSTAPLGRKQLTLIPSGQMMSMSSASYSEFLSANPPVHGTPEAAMVQKVGNRIRVAAEEYLASRGMSDRIEGYDWSFNLVASDQVNAWAMPGGRVVFYTGILPITATEQGLAVVMGHEVAHAIAQHGNERMSHELVAGFGSMAFAQLIKDQPQTAQNLYMGAFGLGTQVGVLLPFSRLHESEADEIGLIFMAIAGYDPREAAEFWKRMAAAKGGQAPPEFLSTHPSDQTRIKDIEKALPKALEYYETTPQS